MELEDCDDVDAENETAGVIGKTGDKEDKLNLGFSKDEDSASTTVRLEPNAMPQGNRP